MLYKVWLLMFKWKSLSKTFIWYFCIAPMMLFMLFLQCLNVWIGEKNPAFCNHSNESCTADLSCCTGYYAVITRWFELLSLWKKILQCNHSYESCGADFSCCTDYYVQTFGSVDEILKHVSIQMKATMEFLPTSDCAVIIQT